jgi:hypothetical protein
MIAQYDECVGNLSEFLKQGMWNTQGGSSPLGCASVCFLTKVKVRPCFPTRSIPQVSIQIQ